MKNGEARLISVAPLFLVNTNGVPLTATGFRLPATC